ncbi:MAG: hypothetical protein ABI910_20735 [Gemmatimonadota bacterium]
MPTAIPRIRPMFPPFANDVRIKAYIARAAIPLTSAGRGAALAIS